MELGRLLVFHVFDKKYIKMKAVFENHGYADNENGPSLERSSVLVLKMFD